MSKEDPTKHSIHIQEWTHARTYTCAQKHVDQWGTELAGRNEGQEGSGRHPLFLAVLPGREVAGCS